MTTVNLTDHNYNTMQYMLWRTIQCEWLLTVIIPYQGRKDCGLALSWSLRSSVASK